MKSRLKEMIEAVPFTPGIYLLKSPAGKILYIGKAKSLRTRLRSYLRVDASTQPKTVVLMRKVSSVDYIETTSEVDALLLEARLIREYQPHYNIELKDDKSYPLLKITGDAYPRIHITRQKKDKKAKYYGPYTDARLLREAIDLINHLFPLRKCRRIPKQACLYYHIGQCLAPCIKKNIQSQYRSAVEEVREFLGGGRRSFMEYLFERMQESSEEYRYEDAQFFKDQMEALGKLKKRRFDPRRQDRDVVLSATLQLRRYLGTEQLPEKIVCFDVSNIQGDAAVASRVSFYRELPDKLAYRHYKIKGVEGINDYAMIQEALRRMARGIQEGRETFIPDLIVIDGGKGHLGAAMEVLKAEGFEKVKLISLAKRFETVYRAPERQEVPFADDSPGLYLLRKIRDEAHRFAISYHHSLKEKALRRSQLDAIPGIGPKRKSLLMTHFDSIEELKRGSLEALAGLPGMNREMAQKVWNYFHK